MKLHKQCQTMKAGNRLIQYQLNQLFRYLDISKFDSPNDWIRTWEIKERLYALRHTLHTVNERLER